MFLSDETNRRAFPMDLPRATGPETGILENFDAVYQDTIKGNSQFGLEVEFQKRYEDTLDRVFEKTGERIPNIRNFQDVARALNSGEPLPQAQTRDYSLREGGTMTDDPGALFADMNKVAERLKELNAQDQSIPTLDMIWKDVRQSAQDAEKRAAQVGERAGLVGQIAGFAGGVVGSFTYRDPVNLATLGIGGVGKTLAARLATEAGAQSVIEGINQFTGVAENRQLLGLDQSLERSLQSVAFAAVGGAGLRGLAEGLPMGLRAIESKFLPNRVAAREILNAVNTRAFDVSGRSVMPDVIRSMDPGNPSTRAAQRALVDDAAIAGGNPFGDTPEGRSYHREAMAAVASDVQLEIRTGEPVNRGDGLLDPVVPSERGAIARNPAKSFPNGEARYIEYDGQTFVRTTDFTVDLGRINGEAIGRQEGPIRLPRGEADPETGAGYGEAHIEARHGDEFRLAGYRDAADFVSQVSANYNQIYRGRSGGLLLVRKNGLSDVAVVQLRPGNTRDFYEVQTAAIYRNEFFKNKEKLWEKPGPETQSLSTPVLHPDGQSKGMITSAGTDFNDRPRLPGVPRIDVPAQRAAVERVYRDVVRSTDSEIGRIKASIDLEAGTIDIGTGQPIPLDTTIVLDEAEGAITIRALLADFDDDEALIQAMKVCAL